MFLYLDSNFILFNDDMVPNKRQAIIWTNDDIVRRRGNASPGDISPRYNQYVILVDPS